MNTVKSLIFIVTVVLFSACSSVRSFKLVHIEEPYHSEIPTKNVGPHTETVQLKETILLQLQQKEEMGEPLKKVSVHELKRIVVQKKLGALQIAKKSTRSIHHFIVEKKVQSSDNFWMDLIKEFFLFMLIGIIVVGIIAAMIAYGNPVVQTIGKVLGISIVVIGFFVLLFS